MKGYVARKCQMGTNNNSLVVSISLALRIVNILEGDNMLGSFPNSPYFGVIMS